MRARTIRWIKVKDKTLQNSEVVIVVRCGKCRMLNGVDIDMIYAWGATPHCHKCGDPLEIDMKDVRL